MSACGRGRYAEAVRNFQARYWRRLLRLTGWNVTKAANLAGINRCHVYRHLRLIGVYPRKRANA